MEATITIAGVETKEGVSQKTQKPWRAYKVKASNGVVYDTFDGGMGQQAAAAVGKTANISYETKPNGYHDLTALHITGDAPAPAPVSDRTPDGAADWDKIGLRKTRCALWGSLLSSGKFGSTVDDIARMRQLVAAAETDIFNRDPAQSADDVIPF